MTEDKQVPKKVDEEKLIEFFTLVQKFFIFDNLSSLLYERAGYLIMYMLKTYVHIIKNDSPKKHLDNFKEQLENYIEEISDKKIDTRIQSLKDKYISEKKLFINDQNAQTLTLSLSLAIKETTPELNDFIDAYFFLLAHDSDEISKKDLGMKDEESIAKKEDINRKLLKKDISKDEYKDYEGLIEELLVEFNNYISHIIMAVSSTRITRRQSKKTIKKDINQQKKYIANNHIYNKNISRAKGHLFRGAVDAYKKIILNYKELILNEENSLYDDFLTLRISEMIKIGIHGEKATKTVEKYRKFTNKVIKKYCE